MDKQGDPVLWLVGKAWWLMRQSVTVNSWGPITPLVSRNKVLQHTGGLRMLLGLCHTVCCPTQKARAEVHLPEDPVLSNTRCMGQDADT